MTTPQKHTPTPWRLEAESGVGMISAGDSRAILDFDFYQDKPSADAEFIVRAVNCHEELLEWVKERTHGCRQEDCLVCEEKRALIAKAEGRE